MKLRQSLTLGAILILGFVLGGAFSWQPSFAQPRVQQAPVGRYQVATSQSSVGNSLIILVMDTATGQLWSKVGGNPKQSPWEDLGTPPLH